MDREIKSGPISALNKVECFLGLEHFIRDDMFALKKTRVLLCPDEHNRHQDGLLFNK